MEAELDDGAYDRFFGSLLREHELGDKSRERIYEAVENRHDDGREDDEAEVEAVDSAEYRGEVPQSYPVGIARHAGEEHHREDEVRDKEDSYIHQRQDDILAVFRYFDDLFAVLEVALEGYGDAVESLRELIVLGFYGRDGSVLSLLRLSKRLISGRLLRLTVGLIGLFGLSLIGSVRRGSLGFRSIVHGAVRGELHFIFGLGNIADRLGLYRGLGDLLTGAGLAVLQGTAANRTESHKLYLLLKNCFCCLFF